MINKISKWLPDLEPTSDIFVVNECDKEDFLVLKELFESNTVYLINNDSSDYVMGYLYLHLHHNNNLSNIGDKSIEDSTDYIICSAIVYVVESLKNYDIENAKYHMDTINNANVGDHRLDKIIYYLEILIYINNQLYETIVSGSMYGHLTKKAWWFERPLLAKVISDISIEANKLPAGIKESLLRKISEFNAIISVTSSRNVSDILKLLSACCYSFVNYYINNKYYITAFLLIHRSLDLYYASEAINCGLIEVKRDYLSYIKRSSAIDDSIPSIHLYKTYFEYIAKTDRISPSHEDIIRSVNKKRNELLHTHGVDSVSKGEVEEAYKNSGTLMRSNQMWKDQLTRFRTRLVVDPKEMIYESFNIKNVVKSFPNAPVTI